MSRVIFVDFDGTLHDSDGKYAAVLDGVFNLSGGYLWNSYLYIHRQIVHRQYRERHDDFTFHMQLLLDHLGQPYDEAVAQELTARFRRAQTSCWEDPSFFPDSLPFMNVVKEKGHKICLSTGDFAQEKAMSVERAGGRSYFDWTFDPLNLGVLKGELDFFRRALTLSSSLVEDAISIGDSLEHDIKPAKSLGMRAIWVNRDGNPLPKDFPKPDHEARDLLQAVDWL